MENYGKFTEIYKRIRGYPSMSIPGPRDRHWKIIHRGGTLIKWNSPNCLCFYTHSTQKSIRQDHSQDKSNLVARIWWLCRKALGKGYSWLVEDWGWGWAIKAGYYLEPVPHNQHFQLDQHPLYNSIVCTFCTSTERKSLPRPLLGIWERSVVWVVSRALSAISLFRWGMHGVKNTSYE